MKYQVIKHLTTKNKLLSYCDTLQDAIDLVKSKGARFTEFSYFGGFPMFTDDNYNYSVQGSVEIGGRSIVCSIDKEDIAKASY